MDKAIGSAILIAIFVLLGLWISWGDDGAQPGARQVAQASVEQPYPAPAVQKQTSLEDQLMVDGSVALQTVRESLLDPQSALFRNVVAVKFHASDGTTALLFCGEVNGRNRFGGYSGYQPFMSLGRSVYTPETSTVFEGLYEDYCVAGEIVGGYPA
jgi:hypothetical protein